MGPWLALVYVLASCLYFLLLDALSVGMRL